MKEYEIYFELFGKKLKTKVTAKSEVEAKEKIKSKIIFHKVKENQKDITEIMKDIFNIFKK